jgi:deoxyribonuclease V
VAGQGEELFVATDVHYLPAGGARAAAVVSADAAFSHLVEDRVRLVPEVQPYQPGRFYLRELPPLHPVLRGTSARPLYVTAAGMPRADAAELIHSMAGRNRMPDALRRVDTLARHGLLAT